MNGHDRTGFPAAARDGTGAVAPRPTAAMHGPRSAEITDRHLNKLAIVYVRQSSPQQVFDHKESRERQYAMADQAVALGWPRDRVLVIDEDQGRSGRTAGPRRGFQHLLAEVTMDHVGLVLGLELCRLSRSSKDCIISWRSAASSGRSWPTRTGSTTPTTSTTVSSWA